MRKNKLIFHIFDHPASSKEIKGFPIWLRAQKMVRMYDHKPGLWFYESTSLSTWLGFFIQPNPINGLLVFEGPQVTRQIFVLAQFCMIRGYQLG